jgi:hypothetical protein
MSDTFTLTSFEPYDRHNYEVVLKNGKKVFFENWEDIQRYWFVNSEIPDFLDYVVIKDKRKVKGGGFGK